MSTPENNLSPSPAATPTNPLFVRLSHAALVPVETGLQSVIDSFGRLGAVILETETLGARMVTFIRVNTPLLGEIADFILQLSRVGDVAVITRAELGHQPLRAGLLDASEHLGGMSPGAQL